MKCAAIFVAALSFGTALSAVLQAREPEAESVRLATGAEVSDTETGLSVRRRDTGELTSVSPSGPEDRSGDGGLEKRWSKSCLACIAACMARAGLNHWVAGQTFLPRDFLPSFSMCGVSCIQEGACFPAAGSALSEAAQIFEAQKEAGLTAAIGGSSPQGSPAGGSPGRGSPGN